MVETEGLIIKEINFGESSKILTVLTRDLGKIQVVVSRARTHRAGYVKGAQLFSYSWFLMYKNKKNYYNLKTVECKEPFGNMRESLEKLSYATYFADIAYQLSDENITDEDQLTLLLNTFHLICNDKVALKKLKPIYELRSMAVSGFLPDLQSCGICGEHDNLKYFKLTEGVAICGSCGKGKSDAAKLNDAILNVMRYICYSDFKKIFWFDISEVVLEYLSAISERYVAVHIERNLKSLKYLKNVIELV